jgi:hypothetical protein
MVFHSPQASHLPCQRPYTAPQFWQMKEATFLAMGAAGYGASALRLERRSIIES